VVCAQCSHSEQTTISRIIIELDRRKAKNNFCSRKQQKLFQAAMQIQYT
jgi:hypothetical protein